MLANLCIVLLLLVSHPASGEEGHQAPSSMEPTGGLADTALLPSDLGKGWIPQIKLLFDPQARPQEIYQATTAQQQREKSDFMSRTLRSLGAEAQVVAEYTDPKSNQRFSMTLYRYETVEALDSIWKRRRESPDFNITKIGGEDLIYVKEGAEFLVGWDEKRQTRQILKASKPSVERRVGLFHIMVSPGNPEQGDPGLRLADKQVEKAKRRAEPRTSLNGDPKGHHQ